MEIKINIPLIDRVGAVLARFVPALEKRGETTEASIEAGIILYYYQKIKVREVSGSSFFSFAVKLGIVAVLI